MFKEIIVEGYVYHSLVWTGDVNADGIHDLVFSKKSPSNPNISVPLQIYLSGNGSFSAIDLKKTNGEAHEVNVHEVIFADLNSDRNIELIVFDNVGWDLTIGLGVGGVPKIFNHSQGIFLEDSSLEQAYLEIIGEDFFQKNGTVAFKGIDIADINGDGKLDFWIESTGSANVMGHFLIGGDNGFEVDVSNRMDSQAYFNSVPNFTTRWNLGKFVDVNGDGYVDMILGALDSRSGSNSVHSSAIVLNNGQGFFNSETFYRLPRPIFNGGNSAVRDISEGDVNNDGRVDLLISHIHENEAGIITGSSLQVLTQGADGTFVDETSRYVSNQSGLVSSGLGIRSAKFADINLDGQMDIYIDFNFSSLPVGLPTYFIRKNDVFIGAINKIHQSGADGTEAVLRYLNDDLFIDAINLDYGIDFALFNSGQSRIGLSYGSEAAILNAFPERNQSELLRGTIGDDVIFGFGGDDTITGSLGNDRIDGGTVTNSVVYAFSSSAVTGFDFYADGQAVVVSSLGSQDTLSNISTIHFDDGAYTPYALRSLFSPTVSFSVSRDGEASTAQPSFFTGDPLLDLHYQLIDTTPNTIVVGSALNDFIVLQGGGNKAVNGGGGNDVIDGGVGSTFVSGGGGSNTFFLDGRASGVSWSTITDFESNQDKATVWGWKAGVSRVAGLEASGGAEGYKGVTLHFENLLPSDAQAGATNAQLNSITFTGRSLSDFGASSLEQLNAQIAAETNPHFVVGQTEDLFGQHGFLYIS